MGRLLQLPSPYLQEVLDRYAACADSAEVVAAQDEFLRECFDEMALRKAEEDDLPSQGSYSDEEEEEEEEDDEDGDGDGDGDEDAGAESGGEEGEGEESGEDSNV